MWRGNFILHSSLGPLASPPSTVTVRAGLLPTPDDWICRREPFSHATPNKGKPFFFFLLLLLFFSNFS